MPVENGTISAVIPAYNAAPVIGRAIESVLAQRRPADEVIVVDDGSTDGTGQAVQRFGDRVRYIRQENAGASAARNTGIEAARSEWIAFLDGDDEWLPDHLRLAAELRQRHPDLRWVTGNFYRCPCRPEHVNVTDMDETQVRRVQASLAGGEVFDSYLTAHQQRAMGCTDTMVIRRDLLIRAGLFLTDQKRMNDVDLWLRIAYLGEPIGYVFEPTALYHMGVPGSILKSYQGKEYAEEFLDRHLALAEQAGMKEAFGPVAAAMLGHWLPILLKASQGRQIRYLLKRYRFLLSPYNFRTNYIQSYYPSLAFWYMNYKKHRKLKRRNVN